MTGDLSVATLLPEVDGLLLPTEEREVMEALESRLPNEEAQLASADEVELAVERLERRYWHL